MTLQIIFLYIIPAILSLALFYYKEDDIKVKGQDDSVTVDSAITIKIRKRNK